MRGGGVEAAARVTGGAAGVRGGVTAVDVEAPPAVRPFSTRISLVIMVDETAEEEAGGEFVFTKRCSRGS